MRLKNSSRIGNRASTDTAESSFKDTVLILIINLNYLMVYIFNLNYPNMEGSKFSQSRSIGILADHIQHTEIPSNIWRFYLLYVGPEAEINYY